MRLTKTLIFGGAFVMLAAFATLGTTVRADTPAAPTAPAPDASKPLALRGVVTAVDTTANTLSFHSRKDGDQVVSVTTDTKIHVDKKKDSTLSEVLPKMHVRVNVTADKKTALEIVATTPKPKADAPAAPTTPAPTTPAPTQ